MIQCNLYVTTPSVSDFINQIKDAFPQYTLSGDEEKGPIIISKKSLFFRQEITFSFMNQELAGDKFSTMIRGMTNFYQGISTEYTQTKNAVIQQITAINLAISVTATKKLNTADFNRVASLIDAKPALGGFVFLPPSDLYNAKGDLIFNADGESALPNYTVPKADNTEARQTATEMPPYIPTYVKNPSASALERKAASEEILKKHGIPINPHLPTIYDETEFTPRKLEEITLRATALLIVAIYAELIRDNNVAYAQSFIKPLLDQYPVYESFSPAELAFMAEEDPKINTVNDFIWNYEDYYVALWSLGFITELPYPDTICDVNSITPFLREAGSLNNFMQQASLRSPKELLDATDFIYRCDWACVDAYINKNPAPKNLNPGVVLERHRMLNWLTRYMDQEWDEISTDT